MSLLKYKAQWEKLAYKVGMYKTDAEALEAVKQDGYALQFVNPEFFKIKDNDDIIVLNGVKYKKVSE